jgi:kynurenine 3-monooxygenase
VIEEARASDSITVVGAGLAGSLLAMLLARRGLCVDVYERSADPRQAADTAGRSINLALSTRGLYALEQVGLAEAAKQCSIPMRGRMIHTLDGAVRFQPYGKDDSEVLYAISRAGLQNTLLDAAEAYPDVRIRFQERCLGVTCSTGDLYLRNEATGRERTLPQCRIIGADGSASAVRSAMLSTARVNVAQDYLEHGYKELTIPPGPRGTFQLDPHALHIWPRGAYMLIALPNTDGSFTGTLFLPFSGDCSFASLSSTAAIVDFFQRQFPDVVPLMPDLVDTFRAHPTGSLVTIKCAPWHIADVVLLLGDAAHAIVPFFGQGMNCAFEDCTYLDAYLDQYGPHAWGRIFAALTDSRKVHTDAIADMAVMHYIEMRDRVADPKFLLQKQIEQELEKRYPEVYIPQYSLVTFHRIPYAVARDKGRAQARILQALSATADSLDAVDWAKAERLVRQELL